jgi:glucan biosynthesis protein C
VGGLIFFHTARIFDPLDFYVKDQPPNLPLTLFVFFAGLWGMPLLFVVSGLGAWYSLRSRTSFGFVRERLARLLVPFLVGLLVVVPPQVYYQLRFQRQDPGSYWQFYGEFFQVHLGLKFPWFVRPDDPPDLFEPAHLWFLYFLLVYSLLLLPVLLYLRGSGRQLLERLAVFCSRPWAILLLALPVAVIEAALGTEESGGWNRYAYIPFLLYGFLLAADPRFGEAIRRNVRAAPPCRRSRHAHPARARRLRQRGRTRSGDRLRRVERAVAVHEGHRGLGMDHRDHGGRHVGGPPTA